MRMTKQKGSQKKNPTYYEQILKIFLSLLTNLTKCSMYFWDKYSFEAETELEPCVICYDPSAFVS